MTPDFVHFLLILYLIYVSDCIVFARASEWILYAPFRGMKWRVKSTDAASGVGGRFWLLRPMLLPLGSSHRLPFPRYSLGRSGVCTGSPLSRSARMGEDARYLDYDAVESVVIHEHEFRVNGETWFKGTRHELEEARTAVESVVASTDREAAVRSWIESRFEAAEKAKEHIANLETRTSLLNLLCSVYAIWLLLFLPVALFLFPPVRLLWNVAVPMLLLHMVCGAVFLRVHAKLLPRERYARWETFFKMFLCPPMMIRACDPINDHVGIPGYPLAVLLSCTDERVWRNPAQRIWRRLFPGRRTALAPEVASAMNEYAAIYRDVMEEALSGKDMDASNFAVDAAGLPGDQRVCPCCETVYRIDVETCSDCGDVPLLEGKGGSNVS